MAALQRLEGQRMNLALRAASGAVCVEPTLAPVVEQSLGHDAAGGVSGAEEEDVVGHVRSSRGYLQVSGQAQQLGPQHGFGFEARTNALTTLPCVCATRASTSRPLP